VAALFGPKVVFDRATRLQAHGPERLLTLGSGAQVSSDAVVISGGAEYIACPPPASRNCSARRFLRCRRQ
jgi:hypothetical protein